MARQKKRPDLVHCRVRPQNHPTAPWRVSFKVEDDGRLVTKRKAFSDEDAAWAFAEAREIDILNHGVRFSDISGEARRAFDFYRDQRLEMEKDGCAVPPFEDLVREAMQTIMERFQEDQEASVTIAEGIAIFIEYKSSRVGDRQLKDLKGRLKRFAQDYGDKSVKSVTTNELEKWLGSLRTINNPAGLKRHPLVSARTRNHYRANLHAFFKYAAAPARGWTERNPLADLEPERVGDSEPEAYTPEDAAKLMQTALNQMPELVPVLALGMFCGLRTSEAQAVDLGKLPKEDTEFRVTGKTGPRMAPFTDAARAWLAAQPRRKGRASLLEERNFYHRLDQLFQSAGVEKIANGPRHSFISYRTAETRDVARVADESGNSVSTIKAHYRQIVTSEEAAKFFAIRPEEEADNVTEITEGRASA